MSDGLSSRLNYLLGSLSQAEVSRATGIPSSTLSYAARGLRELPYEYSSALRNLYQRTTYADMREMGASATTARRFSWYTPEKVGEVMSTYREKTVDYSIGALATKEKQIGRSLTARERDAFLADVQNKIRLSLQESKVPYEDLQRDWY